MGVGGFKNIKTLEHPSKVAKGIVGCCQLPAGEEGQGQDQAMGGQKPCAGLGGREGPLTVPLTSGCVVVDAAAPGPWQLDCRRLFVLEVPKIISISSCQKDEIQ